MPWHGGQYRYGVREIRRSLENIEGLREIAMRRPDSEAAVRYYDIIRALEYSGISPTELEVALFRARGYPHWVIARILGVKEEASRKRWERFIHKMTTYINRCHEMGPK
jgi:DNA-binding CsgD family transcriptional regulator